jgi:hypothetical protein
MHNWSTSDQKIIRDARKWLLPQAEEYLPHQYEIYCYNRNMMLQLLAAAPRKHLSDANNFFASAPETIRRFSLIPSDGGGAQT